MRRKTHFISLQKSVVLKPDLSHTNNNWVLYILLHFEQRTKCSIYKFIHTYIHRLYTSVCRYLYISDVSAVYLWHRDARGGRAWPAQRLLPDHLMAAPSQSLLWAIVPVGTGRLLYRLYKALRQQERALQILQLPGPAQRRPDWMVSMPSVPSQRIDVVFFCTCHIFV